MELQVFNSTELGGVRTTIINGEIMFVGKDVADILGYTNQNEAIRDHVDEEDKLNSKTLSSFELNFKEDGIFPVMEGAT